MDPAQGCNRRDDARAGARSVYLHICFTKMLVTIKGLVTQGLGLTSGAVTNTRVIWD